MFAEDIDLSYKITKAGYKNHYLGTTSILHYKGESTKRDFEYLDRFYGAMQIFYKKHFKTNIFFNFIVKIGVFMAKKSSTRKELKSEKKLPEKETTYVLTENLILLKNLSNKLSSTIKTTSKTIFSDEIISNSQIVFDVEYMSYSQIFIVMYTLRNNGNSYRIFPSRSNFIVGSDQSDKKGVVIVFDR